MIIESKKNKIIKDTASLLSKKGRNVENAFILEGSEFVLNIPETVKLKYFLISESFANKNNLEPYEKRGRVFIATDEIFIKCSDTVNSKGVIAVCSKFNFTVEDVTKKENPIILICDEIQDPGNLGTIIRTSDAANISGVILTKGCCDLYNTKTLRSTAGSIFSLPIVENMCKNELINNIKDRNIKLVSTYLNCDDYYFDIDLRCAMALVVGNEGNGISEEFINKSDKLIKIPMFGSCQSLNVAMSTGIVLYEVLRQRR
ncbi:MAG: TrmH family RNA methyltransferase [Lachnospirales bacterium]